MGKNGLKRFSPDIDTVQVLFSDSLIIPVLFWVDVGTCLWPSIINNEQSDRPGHRYTISVYMTPVETMINLLRAFMRKALWTLET